MRKLLVFSLFGLSLPLLLHANQQSEPQLPAGLGGSIALAPDNKEPAPRLPDGTVDLTGLWLGGGPHADLERGGGLKPGDVVKLLQPWAKALMDTRTEAQDPYSYCMPMAPPRQTAAFPFRFIQNFTHKAPTLIYILQEANIHSYQQIFMDGRKHPDDPTPTWFGHSIGWWEKDTLVVDSIGFNDKSWLDRRGFPRTEQMHAIERWTRIDMGHLNKQVTIDDPGAYTRPFTATYQSRLMPATDDLREYICAENNQYGLPSGNENPYAGK
jgi:hypothetical protein